MQTADRPKFKPTTWKGKEAQQEQELNYLAWQIDGIKHGDLRNPNWQALQRAAIT